MEQIIKQAIAGSDADYTEIRIEQEARSQVLFRKDKLENIEGSNEQGGIVRALKDGGWGIAAFNDISDLPGKVKEATRMAQLVARGALEIGRDFVHESIIGSLFRGRVEGRARAGGLDAIIPSIEGWARITGLNTIFVDDRDPYAHGFQVI